MRICSQFDHVVCQGVYYVVPDAVRNAIWQLLSDHLSPQGIAHISYNTYPGWKQREVAQDFAQFHAPAAQSAPAQSPGIQREQAVREGLASIAALAPQHTEGLTAGYGLNLQAEATAAARAIPGLLFHEFLSGDNRPLYFNHMVAQAREAGFAYLCEASMPDAWPGRLNAAAAPLTAMAHGDALALEQYLDFATARTYRNSLWVAPAAAAQLASPLQAWPAQALRGLHLAADLRLGQNAGPGQHAFVSLQGAGFSVSVDHLNALQSLQQGAGRALWVAADALLDAHPQSAAILHECVLRGLIAAWKQPPSLAHLKPGEAPAWLRREALRAGSSYLPSIWHQPVGLPAEQRSLLAQMDGTSAPVGSAPLEHYQQLGWLPSD